MAPEPFFVVPRPRGLRATDGSGEEDEILSIQVCRRSVLLLVFADRSGFNLKRRSSLSLDLIYPIY